MKNMLMLRTPAQPSWRILQGDALDHLRTMADESVHCCITSPPYYDLRDYGICGQIGREKTPEEYVERLVAVFAEVRRVLRRDGTLWLNLGDSYAGARGGGEGKNSAFAGRAAARNAVRQREATRIAPGAKPKDLIGIPWLVAFALRAEGWYLRRDVIWSKPNPMPESVGDRPTSAHEYIFLFARSGHPTYWTHRDGRGARRRPLADHRYIDRLTGEETVEQPAGFRAKEKLADGGHRWRRVNLWGSHDYFYHAEAIREEAPHPTADIAGGRSAWQNRHDQRAALGAISAGRNRRSVWEIATQPYPETHFATFPERLVDPMVLAGTSASTCGVCGAPWQRISHIEIDDSRSPARRRIHEPHVTKAGQGRNARGSSTWGHHTRVVTDGWGPTCEHHDDAGRSVVLDPFAGSATTGVVALRHGRSFIGIELKPQYAALGRRRIVDDAPLFNHVAEAA